MIIRICLAKILDIVDTQGSAARPLRQAAGGAVLDRPAGLVAEGAVRQVELPDVAQAVLRGADLRDPPISNFFFANCWRARSQLYQNEISQVNMRLAAFFKLYKICTLLHRSKLRFEIT